MNLIKCQECEKMFSDDNVACTYCGCPVNKMNFERNFDIEKDCVKAIYDKKFMKSLVIRIIILVLFISLICGIIVGNLFPFETYKNVSWNDFYGNYNYDKVEYFGIGGYLIWLFGIIVALVIYLGKKYLFKQELIIDNVRVYGKIYGFYWEKEIDIPLSQISFISTRISKMRILSNALKIHTTSGKCYKIYYLLNEQEIKKFILNKINNKK